MSKRERPELSICIVTWNTRDMLDDCLRSIQEAPDRISREVIVVDNASHDGTVEMVRGDHHEVVLIANSANEGFAAANNQALLKAQGEFRMVMNPDILVHDGELDGLADLLRSKPRAGAVAPRFEFFYQLSDSMAHSQKKRFCRQQSGGPVREGTVRNVTWRTNHRPLSIIAGMLVGLCLSIYRHMGPRATICGVVHSYHPW